MIVSRWLHNDQSICLRIFSAETDRANVALSETAQATGFITPLSVFSTQNNYGGASKNVIDMSTSTTRKDAKGDAAQDARFECYINFKLCYFFAAYVWNARLLPNALSHCQLVGALQAKGTTIQFKGHTSQKL